MRFCKMLSSKKKNESTLNYVHIIMIYDIMIYNVYIYIYIYFYVRIFTLS